MTSDVLITLKMRFAMHNLTPRVELSSLFKQSTAALDKPLFILFNGPSFIFLNHNLDVALVQSRHKTTVD